MQIFTEGFGEIEVSETNGEDLKCLVNLPASTVQISGDWGNASFEHYEGEGFLISFNNYRPKDDVILKARSDKPILELHIATGIPIQGAWEGISGLNKRSGFFNLSYAPFVNTRALLKKDVQYQSTDIHFSMEYIKSLFTDFPILGKVIELSDKKNPGSLFQQSRPCSKEMLYCLASIRGSLHRPAVKKYIICNRVTELLIAAIETENSPVFFPEVKLSASDMDSLEKTRNWLTANPGSEFTLLELSRKAGINQDKLKKGFKRLFGKSVYEYHLQCKMETAMLLLREGKKPVEEVAYILGYHYPAGFCKAFKLFTGMSPGKFKQ